MKKSRAGLIREFFALSGSDGMREIKELSDTDRGQLASAIARSSSINESECDFTFVPY